ncbi:hypothetical protein Rcae01_02164 [Novipirellula caenicola]|uniref:Uncharacterized protein n=1 Tax=Novipirellula caenicola TaxID=1536901 RepID=A0ABP9VPK3_9BACT
MHATSNPPSAGGNPKKQVLTPDRRPGHLFYSRSRLLHETPAVALRLQGEFISDGRSAGYQVYRSQISLPLPIFLPSLWLHRANQPSRGEFDAISRSAVQHTVLEIFLSHQFFCRHIGYEQFVTAAQARLRDCENARYDKTSHKYHSTTVVV